MVCGGSIFEFKYIAYLLGKKRLNSDEFSRKVGRGRKLVSGDKSLVNAKRLKV